MNRIFRITALAAVLAIPFGLLLGVYQKAGAAPVASQAALSQPTITFQYNASYPGWEAIFAVPKAPAGESYKPQIVSISPTGAKTHTGFPATSQPERLVALLPNSQDGTGTWTVKAKLLQLPGRHIAAKNQLTYTVS